MRPVVRLGKGFDVTLKPDNQHDGHGTSTLCPSTDLRAGYGIEDIGSGDTQSVTGPLRWRERR